MADVPLPTRVDLTWDGKMAFTARGYGHQWVLDGRGADGPSPVVALASALGGCMGMDVVHILIKGRFDVRALTVGVVGHRADQEPRRFTRMEVHFTVDSDAPPERIERAVEMSHDTYCSVWHSMRQDIAFEASFEKTVTTT
jgi:putative redox protein